jgi:hypothetical protein
MAPLSENVKKSFTPVGVLVKPKSKPWTNVWRVCSGYATS